MNFVMLSSWKFGSCACELVGCQVFITSQLSNPENGRDFGFSLVAPIDLFASIVKPSQCVARLRKSYAIFRQFVTGLFFRVGILCTLCCYFCVDLLLFLFIFRILNLFAEENAVEDTIYYLSESLRKEAIDLDLFLKVLKFH